MPYDRTTLIAQLKIDEGERLKPYLDTKGKLTIGVGRNLSDDGISEAEAEALCYNDIDTAEEALSKNLSCWGRLSDARQRALLNLCYNMGWGELSVFREFLAYMTAGEFDKAADDLLATPYAREVGARVQRIATLIKEG